MRSEWLLVLASSAWLCAGCGGDDSTIPDAATDSTFPDAEVADHASADQSVPVDAGSDTPSPTGDSAPPAEGGGSFDAGFTDGPISITGGPYVIFPPGDMQCTGYSPTAASFEIYDNRDASIDLVLISSSCADGKPKVIMPDIPLEVSTYDNSIFRIDNHADKTPLGSFRLDGNDAYAVTVK